MDWLWPQRIPLGKLTLLIGDPEQGKSFLTMDLAARVTRGMPWPDDANNRAPCGSVVLLAAEDQADDTVVPRLAEAGADLDKCFLLQAARSADGLKRLLFLDRDLGLLRQTMLDVPDCRLIVIDPISAYLGQIDGNSNTQLRTLLFPLAELAAEREVAVVLVSHLNKRSNARALYRTMGSMAFVAVARAAWLVVRDPEDKDRRLMLAVKNNLAESPPGMAFRLAAGSEQAVARIAWDPEPVQQELADALQLRSGFNAAEQEYRDEESWATGWLREQLSNGPLKRDSLWLSAMIQGFTDAQLYRAGRSLGVVKRKQGFSWDEAEWSLPEQSGQPGNCGEQPSAAQPIDDHPPASGTSRLDDELEDDELEDDELEDDELDDDAWLDDDDGWLDEGEPSPQTAKSARRKSRKPLDSYRKTLTKLDGAPAKASRAKPRPKQRREKGRRK